VVWSWSSTVASACVTASTSPDAWSTGAVPMGTVEHLAVAGRGPGHGSSSIDASTSVGAWPARNGKGTAPWILRSRPDRFLPQPKGEASDRTGSRHLPERVGEVHTLFSTGHCTH